MKRALVAAVALCVLPLSVVRGGQEDSPAKAASADRPAAARRARATQPRLFYLVVLSGGGLDVGQERAFVHLGTGSDRWLREPSWLDSRAFSIRDTLLAPVDADPTGGPAETAAEYVTEDDLWLAFSAARPMDPAALAAEQDADLVAALFAEPEQDEGAADGAPVGDSAQAGGRRTPRRGRPASPARAAGAGGQLAVAGVLCVAILLPAGVGLILLRRVRRR